MAKINLLKPEVYNKIAAGEVIERPASAVKELVENSLDAQSTHIKVFIKNGGRGEITVSDNGSGMSAEDSRLAFLKHSTSKIKDVDDLENILTMGFRGEALASIASVSFIELTTCQPDSKSGFFLKLEGGNIMEEKECGAPAGTTIRVKNLFFNTPARFKFLKSTQTETRYIKEMLINLMLCHPEIHFELYIDERLSMNSTPRKNHIERIMEIYGNEIKEELVEIKTKTDVLSISGFVSKPAHSRTTREYQHLFLNSRPIYYKYFFNAIKEGYVNLMPSDRFPVVFIYLTVDPKFVDVNVHPAKKEVRFSDDSLVRNLIIRAIKEALKTDNIIPQIEGHKQEIKHSIEEYLLAHKSPESLPSFGMFGSGSYAQESPIENRSFRIIGQIFNTYILIEKDDEFFIIDQHAAHERVIYERLKKDTRSEDIPHQNLIIPFKIELTPVQYSAVLENIKVFRELGYSLEEFGGNSFVVHSIPSFIRHGTDKQILLDIIDDFLHFEKKSDKVAIREEILKLLACKSAIKAGDSQKYEEMDLLIEQLWKLDDMKFSCPHGRPAIVKFMKSELEKNFLR